MIVYVAGQLEYFEHGRNYLNRTLVPALNASGAEVIRPLARGVRPAGGRVGERQRMADEADAWDALNAQMRDDARAGIDCADVVVAVLDGDGPNGHLTIEHIDYAAASGKPVLGFWNDIRRDIYNESCPNNPQAERLIRQSGGTVHQSLEALTEALTRVSRFRRGWPTANDAVFQPEAAPTTPR